MANVPQDDRFYKGNTLLKWFGITSILMFVATIWMVLDDFGREWKGYQREFYALRTKKNTENVQKAKEAVDQNKLNEVRELLKKTEDALTSKSSELAKIENELTELKTKEELTKRTFQNQKAIFDVRKYEYEAVYGHLAAHEVVGGHSGGGHGDSHSGSDKSGHETSAEKHDDKKEGEEAAKPADERAAIQARLHEVSNDPNNKEALTKLLAFFDSVMKLRDVFLASTQAVEAKQAELGALMAEKKAAEKGVKTVRADLDRLETVNESTQLTLMKVLRSAPIVDMANPTFRIQQIVLPGIRDDIFFSQVQKVDRCTTCHLAIDTPGYENEANPFKTHPRLDLMLSGRSPHPLDKVGCTVCHEGRGSSVDFTRSAHTPRNHEQEKNWKKKYGWHEMHHVIEKMVPLQYTEGKCRVCHKETEYIPKAEKATASYQTIKAAGCYGCHRIEGWDHIRKPAPSLKRAKGKLTRDWIVKWVRDPRGFNEHARMPASFFQSNATTEEYKSYNEAEVQALADLVLNLSESYEPNYQVASGNAERGKELFGTVGCLACHQIQDFPYNRGRFGQAPDLSTVGSKVTAKWMMTWLKNPRHYFPETVMPSLRLSDSEIGDLTAYLMSKRNEAFEQAKAGEADLETQKKVLRLYLLRDPKMAPATNEKVDKAIGELKPHEVSLKLGQFAMARYGCFGCHEVKGYEKTQGIGTELSEWASKLSNKLDFGLLNVEKTHYHWLNQKLTDTRSYDTGIVKEYLDLLRMPHYGFNEEERQTITTGVLGFTAQKIAPPWAKGLNAREAQVEEGWRMVHKYNCQGCHVMEGLHTPMPEGHPNAEEHAKGRLKLEGRVLAYYPEDETLGPPVIVTEGKRIHQDWAYTYINNPGALKMRQQLKVRMPTFQLSNEELNTLVTFWSRQANAEFPYMSDQRVQLNAQEMSDAKALIGKLQCFNCHNLGEKLSQAELEGGSKGIAPNLKTTFRKVRREWIEEFLRDPNKMIPGTRMPGFWPEGQSPAPEILGGNSEAQIKLLAKYVIFLGQSDANYSKLPGQGSPLQ